MDGVYTGHADVTLSKKQFGEEGWRGRGGGSLLYLSINRPGRKLTGMDAMKEIHFPVV